MFNNSFTLTSFPSSTILQTTTTIVYDDHLFLNTAVCRAIAGAFTWAAILITGYHVKTKT